VRRIHLDYQSGTPVLPEVLEAMQPWFRGHFAAASALHGEGLRARDAVARAREQVAGFLGAESPEDILFTSDGTEAANLAVKGAAWAGRRRGRHVVVGAIEHPAVLGPVEFLEKEGFTCSRVAPDAEGRIAPEAVRAALTDETVLVALQLVNHDVGTLQPVREVGLLAAERGIPLYVDAEAAAGWVPVDVRALGASLLSFSAHTLHGPRGAGVLYRQRRVRLTPLVHGGTQEGGLRAGPVNVPAVVGAGLACEVAARDLPRRAAEAGRLQRQLWEGCQARIPLVGLNGPAPGPGRSPAQLNVSVEFVEGEGLLLMLDTQGIAVASGTSCAGPALEVSPVLRALGVDARLARGSLLLSLGRDSTEAEIAAVLEVLPRTVERLRELSPDWADYQAGRLPSLLEGRGSKPRRGPRGGRKGSSPG
jgi:cysteine desulfurase